MTRAFSLNLRNANRTPVQVPWSFLYRRTSVRLKFTATTGRSASCTLSQGQTDRQVVSVCVTDGEDDAQSVIDVIMSLLLTIESAIETHTPLCRDVSDGNGDAGRFFRFLLYFLLIFGFLPKAYSNLVDSMARI
jgi:hypothetical protein